MIEVVQLCDRLAEFVIDRRSLCRVQFGKIQLPEDTALDIFHDEKHRADDFFVLAEHMRARDREVGSIECADDGELAVHGVGGLQQFARRFSAHDVLARGRLEQVGRI